MIKRIAERKPDGSLLIIIQDANYPNAKVELHISRDEWEMLKNDVSNALNSSKVPNYEEVNLTGLFPHEVFEPKSKGLRVRYNPFGSVRMEVVILRERLESYFEVFRENTLKIVSGVRKLWKDADVEEAHVIKDPLEEEASESDPKKATKGKKTKSKGETFVDPNAGKPPPAFINPPPPLFPRGAVPKALSAARGASATTPRLAPGKK